MKMLICTIHSLSIQQLARLTHTLHYIHLCISADHNSVSRGVLCQFAEMETKLSDAVCGGSSFTEVEV